MAEVAGVIALDPARLSGLEVYLQGLGDGCRRRAGRVADGVAGSGVGAEHPVAELERLARVCHHERDDVAGRRAVIEALPDDLPLTPLTYATRTAAREAGAALAQDVRAALVAHPPRWTRLTRLLAELDRSALTPAFAAAFFTTLGPVRARSLPLVLEQAWQRTAEPRLSADEAVVPVQVRLADALRRASRADGPESLGTTWYRAYAGLPHDDAAVEAAERAAPSARRREAELVEGALRDAGYGAGLAGALARAVGWRRAAAALTAQRGVIGVVTAPLALLDDDGIGCDGPEAALGVAAGAFTVVGAVVPAAAVPAALAAGVLGSLAMVFRTCEDQPARPQERRPTVDPASGQSRLPSGHQTNPHVDTAGVPLPPAYG